MTVGGYGNWGGDWYYLSRPSDAVYGLSHHLSSIAHHGHGHSHFEDKRF